MKKTLDLVVKIKKPIKEMNALEILKDFVEAEVERFVSYGYKRENIESNVEPFPDKGKYLATINLYK